MTKRSPRVIPIAVARRAHETILALDVGPRLVAFYDRVGAKLGALRDFSSDDVLRLWYAEIDPILASIREASICRPGCSFCCRIPVEISFYEAVLIGNTVGRDPVRQDSLKFGRCRFRLSWRALAGVVP